MEMAQAANARGVGLLASGQVREATRHFLRALSHAPGWDVARFHLAQALLAQGHYELGWMHYEARRTIPPVPEPTRPLPYPEWRGEPLNGRRIVVFGEQGFGDMIMFARFLPELEKRGAAVTFVCAPEVAPLFDGAVSSFPVKANADFWVHLGSLPRLTGCRLEAIPAPLAPAVRLSSGGGIGVVPAGNPNLQNDANRSLCGADAERLLSLGIDLRPEATGARDFLKTAKIVAALDAIVTVDTAVAHLSASMGKPTYILLPAVGTDWRWLRSRADSPWYPSAKLFRQQGEGWSATLDLIELDLQGLR